MFKIKFAFNLAAIVIACVAAFAFTPKQPTATATLFYVGSTADPAQVGDESRYAENNPSQTCNGGNKACSITVNTDDLSGSTGSRIINTSRLQLTASGSGSAYFPIKDAMNSTTPHGVTPNNKP